MEFQIDQAQLLSMLSLAQSVAEKRSSMPILSHVLLRAEEDGNVCCDATDTLLSLSQHREAGVTAPGAIALGAKTLLDMVRSLPPGPIVVKELDNHWAHVVSGRSEFKLMGMAAADYPQLPSAAKVQFHPVPAAALAEMIARTEFSISSDELRTNLNGALLECDGKLAVMVSTDGHRLTKFATKLKGPKLDKGIVIPRKGVLEIRKVLDSSEDEVRLGVDGGQIFVETANLTLGIKLNDVAFPPYGQVIPTTHQRRVLADRERLLGILTQALVMAPEKTCTVRLEVKPGSLELAADNPGLGQAHQEIEVDYDGEPLTAGFNARYLIDVLRAMKTDRVALEFQGELDPCVLRPAEGPDYLGVVMPMRI